MCRFLKSSVENLDTLCSIESLILKLSAIVLCGLGKPQFEQPYYNFEAKGVLI